MHTNLNAVGFHMNDVVRKGTNADSAPKDNLNLCHFMQLESHEFWMKSSNLMKKCKPTFLLF